MSQVNLERFMETEEALKVVAVHKTTYSMYCYLCGELVTEYATILDPVSGYEVCCLECLAEAPVKGSGEKLPDRDMIREKMSNIKEDER